MTELLQTMLSFPTVPLTVVMGIVLCYWLFVIIGAVGIDVLDGSAEGGLKAAGEAASGAVKAAGDAAMGAGKALAAAKGVDADGPELAKDGSGIFTWLGLGKVPITISASAVTFFAWL